MSNYIFYLLATLSYILTSLAEEQKITNPEASITDPIKAVRYLGVVNSFLIYNCYTVISDHD